MPRRWKNSDDVTYFTEKANYNRIEKLKMDLIEGYAEKKRRKYDNNSNYKKPYNKNKPKINIQKFDNK